MEGQIVLPKTTMRHTRASALRYQQKASRAGRQSQQQHANSQPLPMRGTVLNLREFGSIASLANRERYVSQEAQRREALKQKSHNRAKNWGNTIEALREKKIQARVQRLADVERRQQVIDDQEAAHQEASRRAIIDRANALLYAENERVHRVHSGMQYSHVLAEREVQQRMKKRAKAREVAEAAEWHQLEIKKMAEYDRREEEKKQALLRKAAQRKEDQRLQLAQMKNRAHQQRMLEMEEGNRIRQYAADALQEARDMEAARKQKARELSRGYTLMNEEQKRIKAANAILEQEMDDKLAAYAKEKERIDRDRKANEERKAREKAEAQAKLIKRQFDYLQNLQKKEEAQLQKDQAALERKEAENLAREKARREKEWQETHLSRQQQIQARARMKERERMEEQIILQNGIRNRKQMDLLDEYNEKKTRENAKTHQRELLEQIEAKAAIQNALRSEELSFAEQMEQHKKKEDEHFDAYCNTQLEAYRKAGKSTKPIELMLKKERQRQVGVNYADLGQNGMAAFRD